jgi:hypothetical protein
MEIGYLFLRCGNCPHDRGTPPLAAAGEGTLDASFGTWVTHVIFLLDYQIRWNVEFFTPHACLHCQERNDSGDELFRGWAAATTRGVPP